MMKCNAAVSYLLILSMMVKRRVKYIANIHFSEKSHKIFDIKVTPVVSKHTTNEDQ